MTQKESIYLRSSIWLFFATFWSDVVYRVEENRIEVVLEVSFKFEQSFGDDSGEEKMNRDEQSMT